MWHVQNKTETKLVACSNTKTWRGFKLKEPNKGASVVSKYMEGLSPPPETAVFSNVTRGKWGRGQEPGGVDIEPSNLHHRSI